MTEHQAPHCLQCQKAPKETPQSQYCSLKCKLLANKHVDGECWIWQRRATADGYGIVDHRGKTGLVHRVAFENFVGPIPEGMLVCHHCDRPAYWNPKHLFVGSSADNYKDMVRKGRDARGERGFHTKLNEQIVLAIRADDSKSNAEWATELNVTAPAIHAIRIRRSWRHVV